MQKELLPLAEQYAKQNKRQSLWRRIVQVMACAVVFCTTYALILPAITMERPLCELEEHTHSESCYVKLTTRQVSSLVCSYDTLEVHEHTPECRDENQELVCGIADFVVHEHKASCYDGNGVLLCPLPEIKEHEHTDECYQAVEQEAHVHDETCYTVELGERICGLEETEGHIHSAECMIRGDLICGREETEGHTHGEGCSETVLVCELTVEPHVHTDGCYTQLVCDLPEDETHTHSEECSGLVLNCSLTEQAHVHSDGCYQTNSLCGLPETEGHIHGDSCYASVPDCGMEESEGHTHEDSCYEQVEHLICEPEETEAAEPELICEEAVIKLHTHDEDDCYETYLDENGEEQKRLICEETVVEEHIHSESCFVTEEVPLENVDTLICTLAEGHVHGEGCYDEGGTLVCTETENHTHGEMCYGTWVLACGMEEHTHTEECTPEPETTWYCGMEEHAHTEECQDAEGNLVCGLTEHVHDDKCALDLSAEERLAVEEVEALIEPLPTYDEIMAKLDEFYEADDTEGEEAYLTEVYAQVEKAYRAYMALPEEHRAYVINADKLMELEFIWSRVTLEETYDASAREDDISVVSGSGIDFKLFNYSVHINKTSDHTAWRAIQPYFNFRNSQKKDEVGDVPSESIHTDQSINADHDIDGFTKTHATVERTLDANRNPVLDLTRNADGTARTDPGVSASVRSLAYLFSNTGDHAVTAYNPTNTILQKSGNRYFYNSANNAVDYDIDSNVFRVRNYVERNSTTAGYAGYSDFTPFTYTNGVVVGTHTTSDIEYHVLNADVDYWFGMTMDVNFFQTKDGQIDGGDMVFNFSGDDDVWVFVDDVLVLDLGGTHGTATGSINFATGEVVQYLSWNGGTAASTTTSFPTTIRECFDAAGKTPNGGWDESGKTLADYTEHTLKFFYMERGAAVANCKLDFRLPTLPDKSLTVTKDLVADGTNDEVKSFLEDTLEYKFRVVQADENGDPTTTLFIKPGMTYTILDGGTSAGTGTVGTDGTFSLKPGQSAQFTDMLTKGGGAVNYVVQEIIPENLSGQYAGVEYEVSGSVGSVEAEDGSTSSFITYSTASLSAESTQTVVYRNKVETSNLSILKLTKALAASANFEDGKLFDIRVTLGGQLLPVGTQYQVDGTDEIRTVATAGIVQLQIGETATILEGILSGTEFEVTELGAETGGFTPTYSGVLTAQDGTATQLSASANGVSGTFTLNSSAHVTVTNANYDFSGQIPIYKQALDNTSSATFQFLVQQVEKDTWNHVQDLPGTGITVTDAAEHGGTVTIGYEAGTSGTFYYRISEQRGTGSYVYDDSFYIAEVTVTADGTDGKGTATVTNIWKNGTDTATKILFVNRRTTELMVTKEVTGAVTSGTFGFEATVILNGEPFALPQPTGGEYTVTGNTAYFELGDGDAISISGIPYNAVVTVTETRYDGFVAYYRVDGVDTENVLGDSTVVSFDSGVKTVHFVNDAGYELPNTGGAGTYQYTMGGLLIMLMAAAISLYIHSKKSRKEERPSF